MNILYINVLYNRQEDKNFSIVAIGGKNYVLEQVPKVRKSVSSYLKTLPTLHNNKCFSIICFNG